MKRALVLNGIWVSVVLLMFVAGCEPQPTEMASQWPELTGPYLGQTPPVDKPEVFAPGIISTALNNRDVAMTPDGTEMYFGIYTGNYAITTIMYSKQVDGRWTKPEVAPFARDPEYSYLEPHISPDGKRFFFLCDRPREEGGEENQDIWVMDRTEDGWDEPYNLGEPVSTDAQEYFPSATLDGTLYFTRDIGNFNNVILRSRLVNGEYTEPEKLPEQVNCGRTRYNAFIAPDESYIIVPAFGMEDGLGRTDYYIVFRSEDDTWSQPVNLGEDINTPNDGEYSPYVSPDGKYFFFMSSRTIEIDKSQNLSIELMEEVNSSYGNGGPDIYWMKADFIEELRKAAVF